ncbi:hypothetical protein B296_00005362 [Ensete ventricosum]|uniref:Ubiquitin-like domain-containing protein n=1 Tax=Ensete ventricosum TaxID=4639 RepID=A0A427B4F6_ENSVE|nr:hypothetical protein B296_00005362 [Ensete ventricosum]
MKLTVKTLKGTHFEIRVQPNDTVQSRAHRNIDFVGSSLGLAEMGEHLWIVKSFVGVVGVRYLRQFLQSSILLPRRLQLKFQCKFQLKFQNKLHRKFLDKFHRKFQQKLHHKFFVRSAPARLVVQSYMCKYGFKKSKTNMEDH